MSSQNFAGGGEGTSQSQPDRLTIETRPVDSRQAGTLVTVTESAAVYGLYREVFAMPPMPDDMICIQIAGPLYTLRFFRQETLIASALADSGGCKPVRVEGERQDRLSSREFWDGLLRIIAAYRSK